MARVRYRLAEEGETAALTSARTRAPELSVDRARFASGHIAKETPMAEAAGATAGTTTATATVTATATSPSNDTTPARVVPAPRAHLLLPCDAPAQTRQLTRHACRSPTTARSPDHRRPLQ